LSTEDRVADPSILKTKGLRDFIQENDMLLTAFGVFTGLAAFLVERPDPYLTPLSYAIALLLLVEIISVCPRSAERSFSLDLFQFLIIILTMVLGFRFLESVVKMIVGAGSTFVFGIVFIGTYVAVRAIGAVFYEKTGLSKWFDSRKRYKRLIAFGKIMVVGFILMLLILLAQYAVTLIKTLSS
jgi:hypothetical protein